MGRSASEDQPPGPPEPAAEAVEVLQAATRVLAGLALRSVDASLDGAVSLPQLRLLAVLADLGPARSGQIARALGLEASTITRLADRMVAAGHLRRGTDPGHRGAVTLELTDSGQRLVAEVAAWRHRELAHILDRLAPADRAALTTALQLLVKAAGEGHGVIPRPLVPL